MQNTNSNSLTKLSLLLSLLMGGLFLCAATFFQAENYVNGSSEVMTDLWLTALLFGAFSIFQNRKLTEENPIKSVLKKIKVTQ